MYMNFLSTYSDKKSHAIPQQLYKPASRGLSAIAEILVCTCGSNNWETVEHIWVDVARGLASTELFFFIHATFCVIATGASPGQTKK